MFSFGHCPNEGGGGGPCPNLKIQYIHVYLTAEKDVQVARKKTFFLQEVFPYSHMMWDRPPMRALFFVILIVTGKSEIYIIYDDIY